MAAPSPPISSRSLYSTAQDNRPAKNLETAGVEEWLGLMALVSQDNVFEQSNSEPSLRLQALKAFIGAEGWIERLNEWIKNRIPSEYPSAVAFLFNVCHHLKDYPGIERIWKGTDLPDMAGTPFAGIQTYPFEQVRAIFGLCVHLDRHSECQNSVIEWHVRNATFNFDPSPLPYLEALLREEIPPPLKDLFLYLLPESLREISLTGHEGEIVEQLLFSGDPFKAYIGACFCPARAESLLNHLPELIDLDYPYLGTLLGENYPHDIKGLARLLYARWNIRGLESLIHKNRAFFSAQLPWFFNEDPLLAQEIFLRLAACDEEKTLLSFMLNTISLCMETPPNLWGEKLLVHIGRLLPGYLRSEKSLDEERCELIKAFCVFLLEKKKFTYAQRITNLPSLEKYARSQALVIAEKLLGSSSTEPSEEQSRMLFANLCVGIKGAKVAWRLANTWKNIRGHFFTSFISLLETLPPGNRKVFALLGEFSDCEPEQISTLIPYCKRSIEKDPERVGTWLLQMSSIAQMEGFAPILLPKLCDDEKNVPIAWKLATRWKTSRSYELFFANIDKIPSESLVDCFRETSSLPSKKRVTILTNIIHTLRGRDDQTILIFVKDPDVILGVLQPFKKKKISFPLPLLMQLGFDVLLANDRDDQKAILAGLHTLYQELPNFCDRVEVPFRFLQIYRKRNDDESSTQMLKGLIASLLEKRHLKTKRIRGLLFPNAEESILDLCPRSEEGLYLTAYLVKVCTERGLFSHSNGLERYSCKIIEALFKHNTPQSVKWVFVLSELLISHLDERKHWFHVAHSLAYHLKNRMRQKELGGEMSESTQKKDYEIMEKLCNILSHYQIDPSEHPETDAFFREALQTGIILLPSVTPCITLSARDARSLSAAQLLTEMVLPTVDRARAAPQT